MESQKRSLDEEQDETEAVNVKKSKSTPVTPRRRLTRSSARNEISSSLSSSKNEETSKEQTKKLKKRRQSDSQSNEDAENELSNRSAKASKKSETTPTSSGNFILITSHTMQLLFRVYQIMQYGFK